MRKIVKQVAGIDIAQNELVVCLGKMFDDWSPELFAYKTFGNNQKGFSGLIEWVHKLMDASVPVRYVMEATGVYHEQFAYYLDDLGFEVSIVLPNKISNYARTLDVKTVTDKTSSEAIVLFGLERKLSTWSRPNDLFKQLKQLTRERSQLVEERTVLKNQLHAEQKESQPNKASIARVKKRIALLEKQEKEVLEELKALIGSNAEIKYLTELICSIPGVGLLTAATVLGETNCFDLICNKRQLTSYAGLDVREKQSGTSVKGKPRISKKGNKHIRKAMHMPALTAIRHDERLKAVFTRLVSRHGIKMKAVVAVQRKILEMIFTIYKTKKTYDKKYFKLKEQELKHLAVQ